MIFDAAGATARFSSARTGLQLVFVEGARRVIVHGEGASSAAGYGRMRLNLSPLKVINGKDWGNLLVVYAGRSVYLHWPTLLRVQPSLKPWLRIPVKRTGTAGGAQSQGAFFGQSASSLRLLLYAADMARRAKRIRRLGSDVVGGVPTTHYVMLVDPSDTALRSSGALRDEVWLDRATRLRRMTLDFGVMTTDKRQKARFLITVEYRPFGVRVTRWVPPASQVGSFSDVR